MLQDLIDRLSRTPAYSGHRLGGYPVRRVDKTPGTGNPDDMVCLIGLETRTEILIALRNLMAITAITEKTRC